MERKPFCGVILNWDYKGEMVDLSMHDCIRKSLTKYQHAIPTRPQNQPYKSTPIQYGAKVQHVVEPDPSAPLTKHQIKHIQDIFGTLLYYRQAVNPTIVTALSSISSRRSKVTEAVLNACHQLIDYLATHTNTFIRYHASGKIIVIYTDASYWS